MFNNIKRILTTWSINHYQIQWHRYEHLLGYIITTLLSLRHSEVDCWNFLIWQFEFPTSNYKNKFSSNKITAMDYCWYYDTLPYTWSNEKAEDNSSYVNLIPFQIKNASFPPSFNIIWKTPRSVVPCVFVYLHNYIVT